MTDDLMELFEIEEPQVKIGKYHLGIDPGISGALALLHPDGHVDFYDTPTVQIKSGNTFKNIIDIPKAVLILQGLIANRDVYLTIEKVNAMPPRTFQKDGQQVEIRSMGVTSAFNFGRGYGIWLGIIGALFIPYQEVHPVTWKKLIMADMGKEKDASRVRATQLFPDTAAQLGRKKDHGRADALLLAHYGKRTYL